MNLSFLLKKEKGKRKEKKRIIPREKGDGEELRRSAVIERE